MDSKDNAKGIPDDKLEQVSGGIGFGDGPEPPGPGFDCPRCGQSFYDIVEKIDMGTFWELHLHCNYCGNDFIAQEPK